MKLDKIFLFVFIGGLLLSCRRGSDVYEVFDNELTTLAERAKWNYYHESTDPLFYEKKGDFYLVSFSIVASCQKDSLQNRLSKERAVNRAVDYLCNLVWSDQWIEAFDIYKEFSQDTIPYVPDAGIKSITIDGDSVSKDYIDEEFIEMPRQPSNWYVQDSLSFRDIIINLDSIMNNIQPLMRFSGEYGEMVYGYYLPVPWFKMVTTPLDQEHSEKESQDIWDELDERNNKQNKAEGRK